MGGRGPGSWRRPPGGWWGRGSIPSSSAGAPPALPTRSLSSAQLTALPAQGPGSQVLSPGVLKPQARSCVPRSRHGSSSLLPKGPWSGSSWGHEGASSARGQVAAAGGRVPAAPGVGMRVGLGVRLAP